jgi:hypothetical protein
MEVIAVAGLAMAAVSAVGQIKGGQAANAAYKSKANMAEFKGRSQAIAYKQQGNKVLDGLIRSNAQVNAAAGAGLVQVDLTGSAGNVMKANNRIGITDFNMAKRNAVMTLSMARMQANIYRAAGKTAQRAGIYGAIGTMGKAFMNFAMVGSAPDGGGGSGWNGLGGGTQGYMGGGNVVRGGGSFGASAGATSSYGGIDATAGF